MKLNRLLAIGLVFVTAMAAAAAGSAAGATSTFRLESRKIMDPSLKIDVRYPQMAGNRDKATQDAFNALVRALVDSQVAEYRQQALANTSDLAARNIEVPGENSLIIRFQNHYARQGIVSISSMTELYYAGAAHPSHVVTSLTFDCRTRTAVTLTPLFRKNSGYLEKISDYCIAEVRRRQTKAGYVPYDEEVFTGGAPTAENYAVFNITRQGLLVIFNEYQVGCYAEGAYEVTVPWSNLKGLVEPKGLLANFVR